MEGVTVAAVARGAAATAVAAVAPGDVTGWRGGGGLQQPGLVTTLEHSCCLSPEVGRRSLAPLVGQRGR